MGSGFCQVRRLRQLHASGADRSRCSVDEDPLTAGDAGVAQVLGVGAEPVGVDAEDTLADQGLGDGWTDGGELEHVSVPYRSCMIARSEPDTAVGVQRLAWRTGSALTASAMQRPCCRPSSIAGRKWMPP